MGSKNVSEKLCNERMSDLKEDIDELKADVKKILTNDFPHMKSDINVLKQNFRIFGAFIPIVLTIINIIINLIK